MNATVGLTRVICAWIAVITGKLSHAISFRTRITGCAAISIITRLSRRGVNATFGLFTDIRSTGVIIVAFTIIGLEDAAVFIATIVGTRICVVAFADNVVMLTSAQPITTILGAWVVIVTIDGLTHTQTVFAVVSDGACVPV